MKTACLFLSHIPSQIRYSLICPPSIFKHKTLIAGLLAASSILSSSVLGADFTIANGQTETSAQVLNNGETGTIEAGGELNIVGVNTGITASNSDGATVNNNGSISTNEDDSHAISFSTSSNNSVIENNGTIATQGLNSIGISVIGSDTTITNGGSITTVSASSTGVRVDGDNVSVVNSDLISTEGDGAAGVWSDGDNFSITNSGLISTTGTTEIDELGIDSADGIFSVGEGEIINSGSISVTGEGTVAIRLTGANSNATISGSLSATGDATEAISAGFGSVVDGLGTQTVNLLTGADIIGHISLSGGDDFLNLQGSNINIDGDIDMGTGSDTISFDLDGAVSYAGNISNTESVIKNNIGALTLSGINSYSGVTTINGGTLFVNGSISNSAVTANGGGTLSGTGNVGSVTVSGGTFAPGNSIGTISVNGGVDFAGGGTYAVEVDASGNSDLILASGTATLTNGAVIAQPEAGSYADSTVYTILTADGGLGGTTFDTVSSTLAFLTPTLTYDANNVFLTLQRNDTSFEFIGDTPNQIEVALVLSRLYNNNLLGLESVLEEITTLTVAGAQHAFDELSGVQHTHNQLVINQHSQQFKQVLYQRSINTLTGTANNTDPERGWWIQGFGGTRNIDDTYNATGSDYKAAGFAFGLDAEWNEWVVGLAGSYANTNVDVFNGELDIDSSQIAVYGLWQKDDLYAKSVISHSRNSTGAERDIAVGTLTASANASYDSSAFNTSIEGGKAYELDSDFTLTPYIGFEYSHLKQDGFSETGVSNMNLAFESESTGSVRASLGARLHRDITKQNGTQLQPFVDIAYVRDEGKVFKLDGDFIASPTTPFEVEGTELDRDRLKIGLGLVGYLSERMTLNLAYVGEYASSDDYHTVNATLRLKW